MENKKAAILVLAIVAAVVVTASGAYAMGRQAPGAGSSYPGTTYRSGMGPSMMGGSAGYAGGMMGGHGMMGAWDSTGSMQQYMWRYWNSSIP
ncbi:MAG: hypothetical protein KGI38_08870 [Thaumarchaeota archaeon]|nr:hypothetical protein [Nitrososphaerota archaeon]